MARWSSLASLCLLLLSSVLAVHAAPGPGDYGTVKHAYTDLEAEAQLSPPKKRMRCTCYAIDDPNSSEDTKWFCTEDSDPRCYHPSTPGLVLAQEGLVELQEADPMDSCVCHLQVDDEASLMDFTCSHAHCYQRFAEKKETVKANSWPDFECNEYSRHPTDPCCRCINHKWNCLMLKLRCTEIPDCPKERQDKRKGECCTRCKQENIPSAQSLFNEGPVAADFSILDEDVRRCDCSVCKHIDTETDNVLLEISRSHPECVCDVFAHYPYEDIPECSLSHAQSYPKLESELVDIASRTHG